MQKLPHAKIVPRHMRYTKSHMCTVFIALLVFALPSFAFGAGFARQSIFLSKTSVFEGDSVLVHTIVSNDETEKFAGTLTLTEGDEKIGTVPVTLAAQEAQAISISWKPIAGSHTITATLTDTAGEVAEKTTSTFRVNEKPQPASESSIPGDVGSSEDIQNQLANLSPGVAEAAAPVFGGIDTARNMAVNTIDKGIEWAKEQTTQKKKTGDGKVLSAAVADSDTGGFMSTLWTIFATISLYILSIVRYIIANPAICYPVFAALFIYGLWRLYKRMRRPEYPEF